MCGIGGVWNLDGSPVESRWLIRMASAMQHRGPDHQGVRTFQQPACGLCHRRLAIRDRDPRANQPMSTRDGRLWLSCNGELYNHPELRLQLEKDGYRFSSNSDSEVLLYLYDQRGLAMVEELNGVFAFALLDITRRRLMLVRDRYGARPLYYTQVGERFAFASEVKALLTLPWCRVDVDLDALGEYFSFQNTFADRTLFRGIKMLEPGSTICIEDGQINRRRYWDFCFCEQTQATPEKLMSLIQQGVERQIEPDLPTGLHLSGGLDTGSVAAAARSVKLPSYTLEFQPEGRWNEAHTASEIARHLGLPHQVFTLGPQEAADSLPESIWHSEDLRVGMTYPQYCLSRHLQGRVSVVLSGAGGDELMGGYPWRYQTDIGTRLLSQEARRDFFYQRLCSEMRAPEDSIQEVLSRHQGTNSPLKSTLYFDARTFLHGLLVLEDKLAMAHSVEVRVPLLDNDFVDYAQTLRTECLVRGFTGKLALREALRDHLPGTIANNPKQGFSAPETHWYRNSLASYIERTLLGQDSLLQEFIQPTFISKTVEEHQSGKAEHRAMLWSLLAFEWWCRLFLAGRPLPEKGSVCHSASFSKL